MKIQNNFKSKVYSYCKQRLGAFDYRNGWLKATCPFCGRELKFGINLSSYRTNCFVCNYHSSPTQMIMDIEGLDTYADLIKFLNNGQFTEHTFTEVRIQLRQSRPDLQLPEGFRLLTRGDSQVSNSIRNYCKRRGFEPEALAKHGVGYCSSGDLFGYLIIPFFYNGILKYYNARNVLGTGPRYNNPSTDVTGLGKEFIIFNYDALHMYNSVYICEGAINALTMGERAIATMGKAVSAYQVNELIKAPTKKYIILLDPDAKDKAINLALKLVAYKKVKVVYLPEDTDCNDLGKSKVLKYVFSTRYQTYQDLIKLKNELL